MAYSPDPNYYDDDIKKLKDRLKKLSEASYDNVSRKYTVGDKKYTSKELDAMVNTTKESIKKLESDKKKYGKYGPNFGESAKSNAVGEKFLELYTAAQNIEVTDFESAVKNYEAWKKVSDFVRSNKDIRVVSREDVIVRENGKTVTRQMNVVVDPLKDNSYKYAIENIPKQANEALDRAAQSGTTDRQEVIKGSGAAATRSYRTVVTDQAELDRRNAIIDQVRSGVPSSTLDVSGARQQATRVVSPTGTIQPTGPTQTTRTAVSPTGATGPASTARQQTSAPARGTGVSQPGAGQFRMAEEQSKQAVFAATPTGPTGPSDGGGGGGGGGGGAGGGAGRAPRTALPKNWEATFRRMFPNNAWMLDLDRAKYPKLFQLIQRGVADRMYETQEGLQRFDAELRNTDFYIELRDTDKVRQIKSLVGDLGFDSVPFNRFLTTASNMGWEGETLQQEVYKEAFRKNDDGQYVNPTAVTRAKSSNNYLAIANIGKAYFSQVADTTVENALTGAITSEDVQRQQRELAKTKYGHLANLIDQGFTLEELASPFKQQAAALLERSVDDIDMSQAQFEAAYNYGEAGQKRMMTSGEWEILLRSDSKYGWDRTENAKREARQLAGSIAQAFGKVM